MSVSRFLRRAALTTAMAGAAATLALSKAEQCGVSVRLSRPSPHHGADDATRRGHLGLVRAHPGLRDLNAALTTTTTSGGSADASFFLDAAHALAASALRVPTITGGAIRLMVSDRIPKKLAAAEEVDAGLAAALRDGDHLTMAERAQLRGLRCVLRAKMQPLLDTAANSTGPDNSPQQRSH
uniref:Uncharacterized protein n=1 Tax=Oryza barthii TaxID=65489 RepID=A0A0D3EPQ2_9ORYZ